MATRTKTPLQEFTRKPLPGETTPRVYLGRRSEEERDKLLEQWAGLPPWLASRLWSQKRVRRLGYGQTMSLAWVGLISAAERWDITIGVTFRTYAIKAMFHEINRHLLRELAVVSLPLTPPSLMPPHLQRCVDRALQVFHLHGDLNRRDTNHADIIDYREQPHPDFGEPNETTVLMEQVREAFRFLRERDRIAVLAHCGQGQTLESIAGTMGVTREAVRKMCSRGLAHLRRYLGVA